MEKTSLMGVFALIPKWIIVLFALVFLYILVDTFFISKERRDMFGWSIGPSSEQPLPKGAILLFQASCSDDKRFEDITDNLDTRYLVADSSVKGVLSLHEGDGSHIHSEGGKHSHHVTGRTGKLGGSERYGTKERNAAHKDNTTEIYGTAHNRDSAHNHNGGLHDHKRVGFRICKVK